MLAHCLGAIGAQIVPSHIGLHVVVDNEAKPSNQFLVRDFGVRCPLPVHYVHEPRRGIPQARNAVLGGWAQTGSPSRTTIAGFSPTWLASLLDAAGRHRVDVIYGRREYLFPMLLPFWAMQSQHGAHAEGDELGNAAMHNVLLTARLICGDASKRFDERLAHGEYTDFFHRAARRGARIVYSAEPLVLDIVSPERATLHYQIRRAFYYAASRSSFHRRHNGAYKAAMKLAVRCAFHAPLAIVRLVAAPLTWPFSEHIFRDLVTKGTARLAGTLGSAAGLVGLRGNPHESIDGY